MKTVKSVYFMVDDLSEMGGLNVVTVKVANALADEGYDVHILSLVQRDPVTLPLREDIPVHVPYQVGQSYLKILMGNYRELRRFFKQHHADVIFLMGTYTIKFAFTLRFFSGARVIFSDHGALVNQLDNRRVTTLRYLSRFCAHRITTLTHRNREDYIQRFHVKPERIECIHNWIDDPVESEREASSEGKGTSAPAPGPFILSAGRFSPEKGYEVLVQVAQLVKNRHPDWQWHLFGDGEEFGRIQAEVERLRLQDFLLLKGRADDLDQRYGQYALFVLTSYREGMPLVLLEAKQHRVPMVSFDCVTGPQEIITDGGDGFLIPPGDIEKMADAICTLIERPELRAEMGAFQGGKIESFRKPAVLAQWIRQIEGPQGIA